MNNLCETELFFQPVFSKLSKISSDEVKSLSTTERSKMCKILSENDGEFLVSIDDFIEVRRWGDLFSLLGSIILFRS